MALGIGPGDEVLCPTFTFFATAGSIARVGAKPVFVDSCPICFNLDVHQAKRRISSQTKAIIPVHLFGQSAEIDPVLAIAEQHNLHIIEDAAQSLGATYKGTIVGTFGAFGAFSFFPSKNLGGFGDAGMLVTNDDALAEKAFLLRTHGSKPKYYHKYIGGNFRLDALQASLLRVKLSQYNDYTARRKENAAYYTEKLSKIPGIDIANPDECCCGLKSQMEPPDATTSQPSDSSFPIKLILPSASPHKGHIWNQYTLLVLGKNQRDRLRSFLVDRGIGSEIYYPVPMHQQECFGYLNCVSDLMPVATFLAKHCLSIPIYPELTHAQQDEVIQAIAEWVANAN
jgi:dTDP-4-amino-4,6-dideoxygalactose transaminase